MNWPVCVWGQGYLMDCVYGVNVYVVGVYGEVMWYVYVLLGLGSGLVFGLGLFDGLRELAGWCVCDYVEYLWGSLTLTLTLRSGVALW